ncbi:MAG: hypothetical protein Q7R31_03800 [Candidatus Levybacteria bacterium]|nr:hypothetical protein [Candidatus Levybacteria bacterium]
MNKERLPLCHQKTVEFIERAVGDGVFQRLSASERDQNITFVYNLGEPVLDDLGKMTKITGRRRPVSREAIRQINKKVLREAYEKSSEIRKQQYPFENLELSKPLPRKSREKISWSRRGLSWKISEFVRRTGITDPKEIAKRLKISTHKVSYARRVLRGWEITIPLAIARYRDFAKKVKSEKDNKKLQTILDSYTTGSLVGFVNRHRHDKERILISLSTALREEGFYPSVKSIKDFAEKVKTKGIPIRSCDTKRKVKFKYKQILYVVFPGHAKRIIKALENDPNLQKFKENPIKQMCGITDIIPTIKALLKKNKYGSLEKLASEVLGFRPSGFSKVKLADLLKGCLVPVFKYTTKSTWFYPLDKAKKLKSFIAKRYREIQSQASQVA